MVLVDEFHEIFFNYPLELVNGRLISVVQQLVSAWKVIGVSATFRSDAGIKKIKTILPDSSFITAPGELREKELQLQVFGGLRKEEILTKALALAKEQACKCPVIIFCSSEQECNDLK